MQRSLYSAVSGMRNHQTKMDVIGNNIANVNTTAFKGGRVLFQDILSQTLRGASGPQDNRGGMNPIQVGLGMSIASITNNHTQGSLQATGRITDMAIQGSGFFMVNDGHSDYYTRDGAFTLGPDGILVQSGTGYRLQGWMADSQGVVDTAGPLGYLHIPIGSDRIATPTANLQFSGNLHAQWAGGPVTMTTGIYDSLGVEHEVDVVLNKIVAEHEGDRFFVGADGRLVDGNGDLVKVDGSGEIDELGDYFVSYESGKLVVVDGNGWLVVDGDNKYIDADGYLVNQDGEYRKVNDSGDIGEDAEHLYYVIYKNGELLVVDENRAPALDDDGLPIVVGFELVGVQEDVTLISNTWAVDAVYNGESLIGADLPEVTFSAANGSFNGFSGDSIIIPSADLGTGADPLSFDLHFSNVTQVAGPMDILPRYQDGYPSGVLDSFSVGKTGAITGIYSNGMIRDLGVVALAGFANPEGLTKMANNLWVPSANSGQSLVGRAGEQGLGTIEGSTLEMSNVDLVNEFTEMITTSRAFQANSRVISTSDEMLVEVVNIKR